MIVPACVCVVPEKPQPHGCTFSNLVVAAAQHLGNPGMGNGWLAPIRECTEHFLNHPGDDAFLSLPAQPIILNPRNGLVADDFQDIRIDPARSDGAPERDRLDTVRQKGFDEVTLGPSRVGPGKDGQLLDQLAACDETAPPRRRNGAIAHPHERASVSEGITNLPGVPKQFPKCPQKHQCRRRKRIDFPGGSLLVAWANARVCNVRVCSCFGRIRGHNCNRPCTWCLQGSLRNCISGRETKPLTSHLRKQSCLSNLPV